MQNFCSQCGTEVGDVKFCPNCGAKIGSSPVITKNTLTSTLSNVMTPNNIKYMKLMGFPIVYTILILCNWFKIFIPYSGVSKFHVYNLYGGFSTLFDYIGGGALEVFAKIFAVIILLLSAAVVDLSVRACIAAIKNTGNAMTYVSRASILSIIDAGMAILTVLIMNVALRSGELSQFYSLFGVKPSTAFGFTIVPILLIIIGIPGKKFADKLTYLIWKSEREENVISK